ncbi:MAG TPA: carbohydrate kinase family protein [Candidatus Acidoferrum sp.]|nr:carbohydrate kinase family protein [Candidatus Acidoferrum sp.]
MTLFDAIGFGALNVDKLFRVNRIACAEEESVIIDHEETCGGSAANTMVALARLDCNVSFLGKVARDREGRMLLEDFRKEGVDTTNVIVAKRGRSGNVIGFIDEKGNRALYIDSGVNDDIVLQELPTKRIFQARFFHLTSFVGKRSMQAQKELLDMLPENVLISFDPGAVYARMGFNELEPIIRRTHVMMPNAGELRLLTGKTDYRKGAEFLLAEGISAVAVKLGARGCYVTDGRESFLIEACKVKVVDTTGAGDAFCAGFLYGLIQKKSLYDCGRMGNFVASRCVMKVGARTGLPHVSDLELLA